MKGLKLAIIASLIMFIIIILTNCKDSSSGPVDPSNISFSFAVDNSTQLNKSSLDSLTIESAKVLISYIQFKKNHSDSLSNSKTGPYILHFNLAGNVSTILFANIPDGTYERAKFRIHKPDANDYITDPDFQGGPQGYERYTLIVRGKYMGMPFTYRGIKSSTQEIFLQPNVSVLAGTEVNVTVTCGIQGWFRNNGAIIDPLNTANINIIEDNIKSSFLKGFKDKNKDGIPD